MTGISMPLTMDPGMGSIEAAIAMAKERRSCRLRNDITWAEDRLAEAHAALDRDDPAAAEQIIDHIAAILGEGQ